MAWRNRVQNNLAAGAYKKQGDKFGPIGAIAKGFADVYVPLKLQEQKLEAAATADALTAAKEKETEEADWLKTATVLAAQMFPEAPGSQAAIDYTLGVVASYQGNAGDATARLEKLSTEERIRILPKGSLDAAAQAAELFSSAESGEGGYNALLSQSQDSQFLGTTVSEMTMGDIVNFSATDGDYAKWSLANMPEGTEAKARGLPSTPMGKYQFIGSTVLDIRERGFDELGFDDNTIFNKETQDAMFVWYANDRLKVSDGTPEGKRAAMRGVWEGFKAKLPDGSFKVTDADLDNTIKNLENSAFNMGSVEQLPPSNNSWVIDDLAALTFDQAGLESWQALQDKIKTSGARLTSDMEYGITTAKTRIDEAIAENNLFDYPAFLEADRLDSANKVLAAIGFVDQLALTKFKLGDADKAANLSDLQEQLDKFIAAEVKKNNSKAAADRDPMIFYAKREDGLFSLSPTLVTEGPNGTLIKVGDPTKIFNVADGKLVPESLAADDFIKVYNAPIRKAAEIVEDGVSGITNLLNYRKMTMENPAAFNSYLTAVQGIGDKLENFGSTFNTLVEGGASYQEVEIALFSELRELTGPAKQIFSMQLQAAYDLARLNGSSGQGLSDKELMQNLTAVGYGMTRSEYALGAINVAVNKYLVRVEGKRRGQVSGLLGDEDYIQSLQTMNLGIPFSKYLAKNFTITEDMDDLTKASMQSLQKQLQLARTGSKERSSVEPPRQPTLEEFIAELKAIPGNENATDAELTALYNTTFPTE